MPTDCHAHSRHSDGALTVDEVVEVAAASGVTPSVTDHISRDAPTRVDSLTAVMAYLDDLERADVLRGGEFCWHDALWRELPPAVVGRMTHRVGSLHAIRLADGSFQRAFSDRLPDGITPDAWLDAHVASLESLASEMPVDILAHPTLLPPPLRKLEAELLWTDDRVSRMAHALQRAGIAFEISSRYVPPTHVVQAMVAAGVRLSLGSDGHSREQVALVEQPLALARQLGLPDEALYAPPVHGSRTGFYQ